MNPCRTVCHFSCGAASAVATKLFIADHGKDNLVILNAFLVEEHPDNQRFLKDCEVWFGHPVTTVTNEKYGGSVRRIWRERRYMNSVFGAICSSELKRGILDAACLPSDRHVFGFTADEHARAARFSEGIFPLIERGLTKADCLAIVERAGIKLPEMYLLGYNNANCIGCCKGGKGYWNKIRRDFPDVFVQVTAIQEEIGHNSYFFYDPKTKQRRGLKDLQVGEGIHDETVPECSFFCDMAEQDIAASEVSE